MDIARSLIAPCADRIIDSERGSDEVAVDLGALVRRLILFDRYILQTIRLKELPHFVRTFGYNGTLVLFQSGLVDIECDAGSIAQVGQFAEWRRLNSKPTLPLGSYHFAAVQIADRSAFLQDCFSIVNDIPRLTSRQRTNLEESIGAAMLEPPNNKHGPTMDQLKVDLSSNSPLIALAVARLLAARVGSAISPDDFNLQMNDIGEGNYEVDSNISRLFKLDELEAHKLIERALLAVGRTNERIEWMQRYSALSGSRQGDLPLLTGKLEFLAEQLNPELNEATFQRVLEIGGLPDFTGGAEEYVDMNRLIAATQTPECQAFRNWLKTVASATDEEIKEQLHPVQERIGAAIHGTSGRVVRFIATNGVGMIPGIGTLAGAAASALDAFLLERVIPQPGPTSFISRLYPPIFE